jgi:MFS family permease
MTSERLLPWARPLLISSTLTQATIYVLRPMITYRAIELDASAYEIGIIAALYALFPVLVALQFGSLVGKFGEGKFIILGTVSMALTSLALMFANSVSTLAVATAFAGISHLACMVGGQSMVALRAPKKNYDAYFGYYTFSASLGHLVGPLIAAIVAGSNGTLPKSTSNAFLLGFVLCILAFFPAIKWWNERPINTTQKDENTYKLAISLLKKPGITAAIYVSLAISSVADVLVVFLPLFGTENNLSPYAIGVILAIRAGTTMISRFFLGALSARFSTYTLLMVSTSVSVLACGGMAVAKTPLTLGAIVFIAGFSLGVGQPLTMSLVSQKTTADERALAVSARLMGNRLGQFIVPAGAGVLAAGAGTGAVFIALSILLASTFLAPSKMSS